MFRRILLGFESRPGNFDLLFFPSKKVQSVLSAH